MSQKKCYFFIDDVIFTMRDLTRNRPKSIFDLPFLNILKTAHDQFGMKVQLNLFYRTDFSYGDDEFTLSEMTDIYKAEWEEASDWLKFGFHSKQEYPDYPFINADYDDVKNCFMRVYNEVCRFAGEKSFAFACMTHWSPMSKDGCRALKDCGVKMISATNGPRYEFDGDFNSLPYGHAKRLLHNRKPESAIFYRGSRCEAINKSLCGYNHLTDEEFEPVMHRLKTYYNAQIGLHYKKFCTGPVLNVETMQSLPQQLEKVLGNEYVGYATHEQYFYQDYFRPQADYADKIYYMAKALKDNGYTYFFVEELAD